MGVVVLKKLEKLAHKCFDGDLTMPKVNFWLIGAICLMSGIIYGMCIAPMTHGVTIGCNNGNNNNNIWGESEEEDDDEE